MTSAPSIRRRWANVLLFLADTPEFSTVAGNESTITVNVVSTFLLALLLLPKLQESGNRLNTIPTLTVVSSEMHFVTSVSIHFPVEVC